MQEMFFEALRIGGAHEEIENEQVATAVREKTGHELARSFFIASLIDQPALYHTVRGKERWQGSSTHAQARSQIRVASHLG